MSEIVLSRLKTRISAHCNKFLQDRWFFAISPNSGGFAYFPRKCGSFLELTLFDEQEELHVDVSHQRRGAAPMPAFPESTHWRWLR
jgi:hypothetical protein